MLDEKMNSPTASLQALKTPAIGRNVERAVNVFHIDGASLSSDSTCVVKISEWPPMPTRQCIFSGLAVRSPRDGLTSAPQNSRNCGSPSHISDGVMHAVDDVLQAMRF